MDPRKGSESYHLQNIQQMGKIYDSDVDEHFDYLAFQHFLDIYDASDDDDVDGFNISSRLKFVSLFYVYRPSMFVDFFHPFSLLTIITIFIHK